MFVLCAAAIEALTVHTAKSSDRLKCSTNRFNQTFTSRCRTHTQKRFNIIHREKEIFICTEGDCCSQRLRCCLAGWSRDCECDTPVITTTKWPSRKHATLTMTFNFGWRKTRACRRWKEDKQLSSTMRPAGMISAKNPIASLWCSHSSTTMVSPTFFFFSFILWVTDVSQFLSNTISNAQNWMNDWRPRAAQVAATVATIHSWNHNWSMNFSSVVGW